MICRFRSAQLDSFRGLFLFGTYFTFSYFLCHFSYSLFAALRKFYFYESYCKPFCFIFCAVLFYFESLTFFSFFCTATFYFFFIYAPCSLRMYYFMGVWNCLLNLHCFKLKDLINLFTYTHRTARESSTFQIHTYTATKLQETTLL